MRKILILTAFLLVFGFTSAVAQDTSTELGEKAIEAKILEFSKKVFFVIEMTFKNFDASEGIEEDQFFSSSDNNYQFREHANEKTIYRTSAVLMSKDGILLVNDEYIKWNHVQTLHAISMDGKKYEVEPYGILKSFDGYLLKIKDYSSDFGDYEFKKSKFDDGVKLYFANLARYREKDYISISSNTLSSLYPVTGSTKYKIFKGYSNGLTFDENGCPVAYVFDQSIVMDTKTGWKTFLTEKLSEATCLKLDDVSKMLDSNKKILTDFVYKVEIEYRQTGDSGYYSSGGMAKSELYGIAVSTENVFIPNDLSVDNIQKISKITLIQSEKQIKAEFLGLFKEFGGLLVKSVEKLTCVPATLFEEIHTVDLELLNTFYYKQKFSKDYVEAEFSRFYQFSKGYKDKKYRSLMKYASQGTFVTSSDGIILGFMANPKKYDTVKDNGYSYWGYSSRSKFYSFASLKDRFMNPTEFFDPKAKVKSLVEEKQKVWLGVEFQRIGLPLAKKLKIQEETNDGNIGFIVTLIYANSPAERAGIQKDDILLKIKEKGKAEEVTFGTESYWGYGWSSTFNRSNELTKTLEKFGVGVTVELTFARNHEKHTIELVIEKAPPDLSSAEKYKNDEIGLTVKDITYEIRTILKLDDDFKGVVVYRTESGSPAEIAELGTLEFIMKIDDFDVSNIKEFKEILEKLIAEGKETASFMVRRLAETRFVNIKLKSENANDKPADDEGVEEAPSAEMVE